LWYNVFVTIGIAIPTPEHIDPEFSLISLPQLIAYTKKILPDIELKLSCKAGVRTDSNRNFMLKHYLDAEVDYILHLDCDMVFPKDLIVKYLKDPKKIMGCVYYRRDPPHYPVVYIENKGKNKDINPLTSVDPKSMPKDQFVKVDGIGFGGMMVDTKVYRALGDKKWHRYGKNFGIPLELPNKLSHDLQFCKLVKEHEFDVYVHTGVRAGHISKKIVWDYEPVKKTNDFIDISSYKLNKKPKIAVLMPSLDTKKAQKVVKQLKSRASYQNVEYLILNDDERVGFVTKINEFSYKFQNDYDYFVYVAEDAYAGRGWLNIALLSLEATKKDLFIFNDGKWNGRLASFGMVSQKLIKSQDGYIFYKGYKSHYADTELTLKMMEQSNFSYSPEALLIEVDYNKHGVNLADKKLFNRRKLNFREPYRSMFS